jgi:hypothetical protein
MKTESGSCIDRRERGDGCVVAIVVKRQRIAGELKVHGPYTKLKTYLAESFLRAICKVEATRSL